MIGELLVTALVSGGTGYIWSLTGEMAVDPLSQFDDPQIHEVMDQGFLATKDYMTFNVISAFGSSVIEIYLAPEASQAPDYQPGEDIVRAYSIPFTIPETGQFGLFGDESEGQFFAMEPGTYQVMAEARYLQREEVPAYAEVFPDLNFFLEDEWDSAELRDDAPELWRLTFIPTDAPTEAVKLYRELSLRERRQRGLE